jgi:N-acetylglucosaminyldiphosphoundecaprenol N-acetyl-beta-D-mannosaminyltransferase
MTDRVSILGTPLTVQAFEEAITTLLNAANDSRPFRAHFCTVHTVVEARSNQVLRQAFASADMLNMDGVPLTWVARLRGAKGAERVCGPDVMLALLDRGRASGLRHYLLGGAEGVPEALAASMLKRFPGVKFAGMASPPFRVLSEAEQAEEIDAINRSEADVVWVGLGAPKQEIWAAKHAEAVGARLILPVGAAFDFHSGRVRRAPRLLSRLGLEWLFRIAMEPRRLLGRYLRTNLVFVALIVRESAERRWRHDR